MNNLKTSDKQKQIVLVLIRNLFALNLRYAWYRTGYWSRHGIPGPKSALFVGNLFHFDEIVGKPIAFKLAEWTKKYGSVYGFQRGCRNALVVSDQKLAHEVFNEQFESFHERDVSLFIRPLLKIHVN